MNKALKWFVEFAIGAVLIYLISVFFGVDDYIEDRSRQNAAEQLERATTRFESSPLDQRRLLETSD